jgi:GntR family transcriptional regulator, transcriptional repressor for pyruvate dehydrogenase complex
LIAAQVLIWFARRGIRMFHPVGQDKVADEIVSQIERLVLEGVLRPGDQLPAERDLAGQFGVSRPTLRQALGELEATGLLVARQGGGTFVADVMRSVFADPIIGLFGKHEKATADYLEFRTGVEAMAAHWAALRATDADREILTSVMQKMESAHLLANSDEEARLDVELHIAVSDASHNIVLIQSLRSIYNLLQHGVFYNRHLLYNYRDGREDLLAQHRTIYEAVMARDPDAAEAAVRAHMDFVERVWRESDADAQRQQTASKRLGRFKTSR